MAGRALGCLSQDLLKWHIPSGLTFLEFLIKQQAQLSRAVDTAAAAGGGLGSSSGSGSSLQGSPGDRSHTSGSLNCWSERWATDSRMDWRALLGARVSGLKLRPMRGGLHTASLVLTPDGTGVWGITIEVGRPGFEEGWRLVQDVLLQMVPGCRCSSRSTGSSSNSSSKRSSNNSSSIDTRTIGCGNSRDTAHADNMFTNTDGNGSSSSSCNNSNSSGSGSGGNSSGSSCSSVSSSSGTLRDSGEGAAAPHQDGACPAGERMGNGFAEGESMNPVPVAFPLQSAGAPGLLLLLGPRGSGRSSMLRDIAKGMTQQQQLQQQRQQQLVVVAGEGGGQERGRERGGGQEQRREESQQQQEEEEKEKQQHLEYSGQVVVVEHEGDVGGGGPGPHR